MVGDENVKFEKRTTNIQVIIECYSNEKTYFI